MNINFTEIDHSENTKTAIEYAQHLTGVGDDFWEHHIVTAQMYDISVDNKVCGVFSIYNKNMITMFTMNSDMLNLAQSTFKKILDDFYINFAFVLTCDDLFLSLCLDYHLKIELQAYMFDGTNSYSVSLPNYSKENFKKILPQEIDLVNAETENFFIDVTQQMLIDNTTVIYRLKYDGETLGYGVIVPMLSLNNLWSCGMVTLPQHRQKGVGKNIQLLLANICRENNKTAVSGCWYYNTLSKKTIESSGRYTKARLLKVTFEVE